MRVAVEIVLSDDEVVDLSKFSKSRSVSVRLAERSRIVLLAGKGMTNEEIGFELGITRQKAGRCENVMQREELRHPPGCVSAGAQTDNQFT